VSTWIPTELTPTGPNDRPPTLATPAQRPRRLDGTSTPPRQTPRSVAIPEVIPRDRNERLSRFVNFTIAAATLLVTSPVLILLAIVVKLTSRGPILYAQTRVGLDRRWRSTLALHERRLEDLGGQVFTIYKYRTMRVDAERGSGVVWAQENDPRVTRLGKYMRILRLDEFPQFWNVLLGDMNVVGPRPERPSIVSRLREDIPGYQCRHRVKPGITGLAQINQNYDACIDDVRSKVRWDLRYIQEQGFWADLMILLRTVPSVLLRYRGW
jgi:lipopolysaccharide/colanic/teichoic acid biosynthesis glycosyltransferase